MSEAWHVDNAARLGFLSTKKANCFNVIFLISLLLSWCWKDYLWIDVKWIPWALAIEDLSTRNVQNDSPQFGAPIRLLFVIKALPARKKYRRYISRHKIRESLDYHDSSIVNQNIEFSFFSLKPLLTKVISQSNQKWQVLTFWRNL